MRTDSDRPWMQGFPPPANRTVRFEDLPRLRYPAHRWLYSHWREVVPTTRVWRGGRPARPLREALEPLDEFAFDDPAGGRCTLAQALVRTDTDGLLILHDGKVIFERYLGALGPHDAHRCFSVTKSFVGLLAEMLAHERALDPASPVVSHLPELRGSAWNEASVRQVMDMTLSVAFDEDYENPDGDVVRSRRAYGSLPSPPGYAGPRSTYEYLPTLQASGPHDRGFQYVTPNTHVLAWIVQRLAGRPLADLLSERIWQRIGAEEDGYFSVDPVGIADAGGGLCVTLRDLARFGETIRERGRVDGETVIPQAVIDGIAAGADREKFRHAGYAMFEGWSYRSQWWISHDEHAAIRALGVYGQQLYVSARAGLVIARFGSQPTAVDEAVERLLLSAYAALAKSVAG